MERAKHISRYCPFKVIDLSSSGFVHTYVFSLIQKMQKLMHSRFDHSLSTL